ncbi:MAG: hypothetical protein ACAH95_06070 [Fimbriimonas sp.]
MSYVLPEEVTSPARSWKFERVVHDHGEGRGVYCLGYWDLRPVICFRWNGAAGRPKGNPTSRGFPTWVVLADEDYPKLVKLFSPEMEAFATKFLRFGQPRLN